MSDVSTHATAPDDLERDTDPDSLEAPIVDGSTPTLEVKLPRTDGDTPTLEVELPRVDGDTPTIEMELPFDPDALEDEG